MKKGAKQCQARGHNGHESTRCRQEAVGAVLITGMYGKPLHPTHGVYACREHLEECVKREAATRLEAGDLVVARAKRFSQLSLYNSRERNLARRR